MSLHTVSVLKSLNVVNNSTSSIIQLGDRQYTYQYNQGISILRNWTTYGTDEPYFQSYPMFLYNMPPLYKQFSSEKLLNNQMYGTLAPLPSLPPTIEVGRVSIVTNSSSSNIHIGNGCKKVSQNRQKNIRQFYNGLLLQFPQPQAAESRSEGQT